MSIEKFLIENCSALVPEMAYSRLRFVICGLKSTADAFRQEVPDHRVITVGHYFKIPEPQEISWMGFGEQKSYVRWSPQNLYKLPSVMINHPYKSTAKLKVFILPIIDRVIVVNTDNKIVPFEPSVYVKPDQKTFMILPVSGIYWNFQFWEVNEITLTSHDRKNISLRIADQTFPITDQQLVNIIY